jgi:hypothetical protein
MVRKWRKLLETVTRRAVMIYKRETRDTERSGIYSYMLVKGGETLGTEDDELMIGTWKTYSAVR